MATLLSINPATEEVIAEFPEESPAAVEAALSASARAFRDWRKTSIAQRGDLLVAVAGRLRTQKSRLAGIMTAEMGKPIVEGEAEVEKCAWCCEYYAEHTHEFLADLPTMSGASESYVAFDPLGPILGILAWNFPFWQVFRAAVPILMAGNTMLLKHASIVPQCARAIEDVFREAGLPEGVFQSLLVSGKSAGSIIADDRVQAVTFVGSTEAGAAVARLSGQALKKSVLELGGSDAFIVLADADLELTARVAVNARYQNGGQDCIAAKRFIVVDAVADEFLDRLADAVTQLRVDDPMLPTTQIGPMARGDLRDDIADQVGRSLAQGARLVLGGQPVDRRGYFYAPTVLTNVHPGIAAFDEETFGPIAAVARAKDADDAIRLANQSPFGLGSSIWTRDIDRAKVLARDVEAGMVFVNGLVSSDPRLPFGGVKRSGWGRELSEFGIREFVNVRTVWIGPARTTGTACTTRVA